MKRAFRILPPLAACVLSLAAHAFQGPLSVPAPVLSEPARSPMFAAKRVGRRVVAVGRYGVIAVRDGDGPWRQAKVGVSNDLVDVAFGSERDGWAVGHGGVVLHTTDGGATWARQLDGQQAGTLALEHYRKIADQLPPAQRDAVLEQVERWAKEGTTQPFLGVWFKDAKTGFIVGTFGRIFRTADGGEHWTPLIERIANPQELHLYAVGGHANEVYLVGESGNVWRWDGPTDRFVNVATPYNGSLFGVLVSPQSVLAFGMRGSVFRSTDRGAHWQQIPTGITGGIVSGDVRPNGDIVLVSQAAEVLVSTDGGATFKSRGNGPRIPAAGIVSSPDGGWLTVGSTGIRIEQVAAPASSLR
jgi:photosystem II stability/assembly factor-like uncharacterized protein